MVSPETLKVWLDFSASVIGSLAWPVALVFSLLLLKKPIRELMPLLKKLKLKDVELEFAERLKEIKQEAEKYLPAPIEPKNKELETEDKILELLVISHAAGITEAWREVELAAFEAASRHGIPAQPPLSKIGQQLKDAGIFDDNQLLIYRQLMNLRNMAVHKGDNSVSEKDALAFVDLALQLATHLRKS